MARLCDENGSWICFCQPPPPQGIDDLADVVTGVDELIASGFVASDAKLGIYGGSYGGYMTFAAATFSDRFDAAVPQFGFIDNRQMSLITGDCELEL